MNIRFLATTLPPNDGLRYSFPMRTSETIDNTDNIIRVIQSQTCVQMSLLIDFAVAMNS